MSNRDTIILVFLVVTNGLGFMAGRESMGPKIAIMERDIELLHKKADLADFQQQSDSPEHLTSTVSGVLPQTITSSAYPVFEFNGPRTMVEFHPVVDVVSPVFVNAHPKQIMVIVVVTDGKHEFKWNGAIAHNACAVITTIPAVTVVQVEVGEDGNTIHGIGCIGSELSPEKKDSGHNG